MRLTDRVAVVTGAGRGVGRAIALLFAREGATVVVADNGSLVDGSGTSGEPAEAVVDEIVAAGGTALAAVADVSSWDEARDLVERPLAQWGRLDILVNCAGNFVRDTIGEVTPESLARVRRVHLDGMVNTSHFAALHWIERGEYGRYLASPEAGYVTGRVFGSYGYRYARWSEPAHEVVLESDGPWDLDRLFERFPATLGAGLSIG